MALGSNLGGTPLPIFNAPAYLIACAGPAIPALCTVVAGAARVMVLANSNLYLATSSYASAKRHVGHDYQHFLAPNRDISDINFNQLAVVACSYCVIAAIPLFARSVSCVLVATKEVYFLASAFPSLSKDTA
ncbi:hypothetical protein EVAR_51999_1 [Eumeta japonica]|uniref:Uncharacterized protein n=1 Tax=Eumeta variegata TaxID=151549 RepID=A0A4C1XZK3_EUMVA|nr:hypothetical protein EVAR_51999_1 [Eumeta japonica]